MSTPVCLKDSLSQCVSYAVVDGLVRAAYEELILGTSTEEFVLFALLKIYLLMISVLKLSLTSM